MKRIAIFYICTGKYDIFWNDFFASSENHFCRGHQKHYFVFTDSTAITPGENVTVIYQDNLGWPMIACYRYRILLRMEKELGGFDLMAFFNANALFVADISREDFFGGGVRSLVCAQHPLFYENPAEAPFEKRPGSTAFVPDNNRKRYCQSAISAGTKDEYLSMLHELADNTETDLNNGIVAAWHDESHWNAYINNNRSAEDVLNVLSLSFIYPEGYQFSCEKKIMMRDKRRHGGIAFLRGSARWTRWKKLRSKLAKIFRF